MLKSEVIGPVGSGGPLETGQVICPGCAHNFTAIPENARERIAELENAIAQHKLRQWGGDGVEVSDDADAALYAHLKL